MSTDLRALVSEHLGRFWRPEPEAGAEAESEAGVEAESETSAGTSTETSAGAGPQEKPHTGPTANALREEVAVEIAAMLGDRLLSLDSSQFSLPLGARLRARGIFEDDWNARPTAKRPYPVVLLHGTTDSKGVWQMLGTELRADGYAVFAPDYGTRATGTIEDSVAQVSAYLDVVRQVTGADKLILVGHSQGGLIARLCAAADPAGVRHIFCLATPNHGTTQGGIVSPLITSRRQEHVMRSIIESYFGPAGMQQIAGSELLAQLNTDGDLLPGITYTCVATRQDTVVVPPETCFLDPGDTPPGTVRNVYVQDIDKRALVLHQDLPMDRRVRAIVHAVCNAISSGAKTKESNAADPDLGALE